jgi:glycosyltransferase involved in cell wall biosynthesis
VSAPSNPSTHLALASFPTLVRTLRDFRPDVVHIHTPLALGVAGIAAAGRLGLPRVQTYHSWIPGFLQYASPSRLLGLDRGPRRAAETSLARALTRIIYNRADLVLAPSEALVAELVAAGVRVPVRFQTNAIDLSEFPPKTGWGLRRRVMHCGRFGYEKNVEVVVEAFARFAADRPDWELHLLGEGPAAPYVRSLIERLGIAGQVSLEGFVSRDHLAASYREADVFVTASTIETQGLVVLEAMASGTPVVGVRALALPEVVCDGRNGIIVEPYNPQAMAQALARLADDGALRERMGRQCIVDARAHDLEAAIDRLEAVYHDVVAAHRTG